MNLRTPLILVLASASLVQAKPPAKTAVKPGLAQVRPGSYAFERIGCTAGESAVVRERSVLEVDDAGARVSVSTASADLLCAHALDTHPEGIEWKNEQTQRYAAPGRTGVFEADGGSFWWSCAMKKQDVHSNDVIFPACDARPAKLTSLDPKGLKGLACVTSDQKTLFWMPDAGLQTVAQTRPCGTSEAVRQVTRTRFAKSEHNLTPDLAALAPGRYEFQRMACDEIPQAVTYARAVLEVSDAGVRLTRTPSKARGTCSKAFPELVRLESGSTVVESEGPTGLFEWADAQGVEGKELWRCTESTEAVHSRDLTLKLSSAKKAPTSCPKRGELSPKSKKQQLLKGIRCETSRNELFFWAPDAGVIETVSIDAPCGTGEALRTSR